jgi:hypothetical protein
LVRYGLPDQDRSVCAEAVDGCGVLSRCSLAQGFATGLGGVIARGEDVLDGDWDAGER